MEKLSVLVVNKGLDHRGIVTNAAFVIGLSAGKLMPEDSFGEIAVDKDGSKHYALTNQAHFVRKAGLAKIKTLREKLINESDVHIVDYTEDAAPSDYNQYLESIKNKESSDLIYRAIWLYGSREKIEPLTKNLSSLN